MEREILSTQQQQHNSLPIFSNERPAFLVEALSETRNRSLSLIIPDNFVPKLKPKKNNKCPSPVTLTSLDKKYLSNQTASSQLSMSFDGDESTLNLEEAQQENSPRFISKDDTFFCNIDNLLKDYCVSNCGNKGKNKRLNSVSGLYFKSRKSHSLKFWSMEKERTSSILSFLESTVEENNLN